MAAEHGAIGCIIFSDPSGDGYSQGDVYPKGGWRSDRSVQRGSVADMPTYSGDPLTPGVGATENAKRLDLKDATTLTKIPVLPISYGDALPLLKALAGPMAPADWRGSLPIPYHLGPGPARVHLKLEFNWNLAPIYDVIARLPGSERPDEWVIRGNHHDAWVNGASDPISGMVAELAEARALGELAKSGWKPKRTIVYAAWDGEEPGLLGSTEWAETHADELRQHAAVYINSDSNARGFFGAGGSHTLETFVNQVARDVTDPEKGISVLDRALAATTLFGAAGRRRTARAEALPLEPLGSGSDFTPFLQHLGIAALNIGYGGEEEYGQYHSIYDSFDHFTRFVDPTFAVRRGAGQDRRPDRAPPRRRRRPALRLRPLLRHRRPLRRRGREARRHPAQGDRGAQPPPRRQGLPGGRRSDPDLGRAAAAGRRALPQLLAAAERRGGPQDERRRLRTRRSPPPPPAARRRPPRSSSGSTTS